MNIKTNPYSLTNYGNLVNLGIVSLAVVISLVQSIPSKKVLLKGSSQQGVRLQPELDKVDLESYLANRKALALQVQCVVFDGPCDWVGRWVKPRVTSALLGECLLCTEYQKSHMERIMTHIEEHFPEEFKIGVQKYLQLSGVNVPASPTPTSLTQMIMPSENATLKTTVVLFNSTRTTQVPFSIPANIVSSTRK